jgi:taurine dioxygenase
MYPHSVHPIIERHPVTGEEFIDVSEMMTSHVVGWDDATSERLFEELAAVAYRSENTYRHDWRLRDFVVWDNIALQHKREAFPGPGNRTLRRVLANPYELGTLYAAAEAPEWEPARRY